MSNLCKYKNIIGEPKTGVHQYRIMDIAVVDVIVTIFIIWIVSKLFKIPILYSLAIVLFIMIVSHRLFCVRTTTDKWLFPDK